VAAPETAAQRAAQTPDPGAMRLARGWQADPHAPPWARRYTTTASAAVLAGPAAHGWSPRDVDQLIRDWIVVGHWLPDVPHKPIGLLRAIVAWHASLAERPAALEEAREAAERAAHRAQLCAQAAAHAEHVRARAVGRRALGGPGHAATRAVAAEATRHAGNKRTQAQVFLFAAVPSPGGAPASAPTPHPDLGDIQANLPRLSVVEKVS
jgi:hypothetical protein